MTDYRLVPVEPTLDMLCEGMDVYGSEDCAEADVIGIYKAMLAAAPAVQVEPVSAQFRYRRPERSLPSWSAWSAWQPAKVDETRPTYHFDEQGWEVEYRLLYTAPQPAEQQPVPDVAGLVEALNILRDVRDWDSAKWESALPRIDAILAAHRKQGGEA